MVPLLVFRFVCLCVLVVSFVHACGSFGLSWMILLIVGLNCIFLIRKVLKVCLDCNCAWTVIVIGYFT